MILSVIGDSICGGSLIDGVYREEPAYGYPAALARRIGATEVTVRHIAGGFTYELVALAGALPAATNLLIVNAGTNDIFAIENGTATLDLQTRAFDGLLAACRAHMPAARIAIVGLRTITETQRHSAAHAAGLRAAASALNDHYRSRPRTTFVDIAQRAGSGDPALFPDSIHPSPAGIAWLTDAIVETLVAPIRLSALGAVAAEPHAYPVLVAQAGGASALDVRPAGSTDGMLQQVAHLAADTRMLLIAAATSDVAAIAEGTTDIATVKHDFDALLDACRERMPGAHIVIVGLRSGAERQAVAAALNAHYGSRSGVTFVDLADCPEHDAAVAAAVIAALGR